MFDYKFEHGAMYKITFYTGTTFLGYYQANSTETKPSKTELIAYYVNEKDDNLNFCMGISNDELEKYFSIFTIPKSFILERPSRLLLQPNLDFIESNDELIND